MGYDEETRRRERAALVGGAAEAEALAAARARIPADTSAPARVHARVWLGSASALVVDMTHAGRRGKKCRTVRVWLGHNESAPSYGEARHFLDVLGALDPETGFDDVMTLARAVKAECPWIPGVWSGSLDDDGVHLRDLTDTNNEPTEITHDQAPARAYALGARVWPQVQAAKTMHEAARILRDAGCRLHYFCAVD